MWGGGGEEWTNSYLFIIRCYSCILDTRVEKFQGQHHRVEFPFYERALETEKVFVITLLFTNRQGNTSGGKYAPPADSTAANPLSGPQRLLQLQQLQRAKPLPLSLAVSKFKLQTGFTPFVCLPNLAGEASFSLTSDGYPVAKNWKEILSCVRALFPAKSSH